MVKQMVENYGGSIAVESQLGQGTRFKVLPGLTVFTGLMPGSRR
jgi:chemotaxis protein histidine kinase CheA